MSTFDNHYPEDKVSNTPLSKTSDVELGSPPSYPLTEPEELVVGGTRSRCQSWRLFRRNGRCDRRGAECGPGRQRRCKILRVVKWLFLTFVLLSLAHFVVVGVQFHKAFKTLKCTTITPANATDGLHFTLPLAHSSSRVFVHDSLTGGDTHITHDSTVADGTVRFGLKFSKDTKHDEVFDGCMVHTKHGLGVALIPRECHGARAKIASLSLNFPSSVTAPAVHFVGKGHKHLSDRKLRKIIRWWRKHHDKNNVELVEGTA